MNPALAPMFTFIKLTSGRRMHALRRMRDVAVALGETDLVAHLDQAIAHERKVRRINQRWKSRKRGKRYGKKLQLVDQQLDTTVSALRDLLVAYIKGAEPDDDKRLRAERVMNEIFPEGVYAITSLPYVEELDAVDMLLEQLAGSLSADADALHLHHLIARIDELANVYRGLLDEADNLDFATVKAIRERGHGYMLEAVAMVVGRYYKIEDALHQGRRKALLTPIAEQDEAMRAHLRRRRQGGTSADEDPADTSGDTSGDAAGDAVGATPSDAASDAVGVTSGVTSGMTSGVTSGVTSGDPFAGRSEDEILDMLEDEEASSFEADGDQDERLPAMRASGRG